MPIRSFSQHIDHAATVVVGGSGAGKPILSSIELVRDADYLSPDLNRLAARGNHVGDATILLANGTFRIRLTDVVVDDIAFEATQNAVPQEHVGLAFARIQWEWTDGGPSSVAAWDVLGASGGGSADVSPNFVFFGPGVPVQPGAGETPFTKLTVRTTVDGSIALGTGGGGARPSFSSLTMVTGLGSETIQHLNAAVAGTHSPGINARFTELASDGTVRASLKYSLVDVTVTSLGLATTPTGAVQETVGFDYGKIKWEGLPPNGGGSHVASWDLTRNAEL